MRALLLLFAVAALAPIQAEARPAADLVIVWAPGAQIAPIEKAARTAGAAVIDRSPTGRAALETSALIRRGISAYDMLQLADAERALDEARVIADRTGAAELTQTELSDLFLYRGLVRSQQGNVTAAWDELVAAVTVAPTRVLDPARFPPRVATEFERVRTSLAERAKATLAVDAPATCAITIDGVAVAAGAVAEPRITGPHWASVTCPDRAPWGVRVELTANTTVTARNPALVPPTPDEMLIQARTAGAQAFVVVEVSGQIATARLVGIDGRERDRRTATVGRTLEPLASGVRDLLVPPRRAERWYQSRWVWAAGAAVIAAAILIPVTAAAASDSNATTWTSRPEGVPSW